MARTKTRSPRRLTSESRRDQLVKAAAAVIAKQGYAGFSLDDVAERADVTRNLLYHYFPRGRLDLFLAALDRAGSQLTEGWVTDSDLSTAERTAANFERVADHVMKPSDFWLVYRQAEGLADREVQAMLRGYQEIVLSSVAMNQLGTDDPPPAARVALTAYLAYVETALDSAREQGVPRDMTLKLLVSVLEPMLAAAASD
jgi:AcrR family transcriptional regulator